MVKRSRTRGSALSITSKINDGDYKYLRSAMERVTYIKLGTTLLPLHVNGEDSYIFIEDLPGSITGPLRDWLVNQTVAEQRSGQLPEDSLSQFHFTAFLIEHNLQHLLL